MPERDIADLVGNDDLEIIDIADWLGMMAWK